MLIKSGLLTQMSGSIGGMTGSHNRGGLYLRARSIPVNTNTARQVAVRSAITSLTSAWNQSLTATQRAAWNLYGSNVLVPGALGDPIQLSGQNQYIRSNTPRLQAGLARIDAAPTVFDLGDPGSLSLTSIANTTNSIVVAIGDAPAWAADDDATLLMYQGRPQNAGRLSFNGPYRFVGTFAGNSTTPVTSADTGLAPFALPYTIAAGQSNAIFCRVSQADGRLSGRVKLGPIIVSA